MVVVFGSGRMVGRMVSVAVVRGVVVFRVGVVGGRSGFCSGNACRCGF